MMQIGFTCLRTGLDNVFTKTPCFHFPIQAMYKTIFPTWKENYQQ